MCLSLRELSKFGGIEKMSQQCSFSVRVCVHVYA